MPETPKGFEILMFPALPARAARRETFDTKYISHENINSERKTTLSRRKG